MEYERALFRVYERTMDTLRFDQPCIGQWRWSKPTMVCTMLMHACLMMGILFLTTTTALHLSFVGDPGCVKTSLEQMRQPVNGSLLAKDEVLRLHIRPSSHVSTVSSPTNVSSSPADYTYVRDAPLLYFNDDFFQRHNVSILTLTMDEYCMSKGPTLSWLIGAFGNWDSVVINQLLYTFRDDGLVQNMQTKETWGWPASLLPPPNGYSLKVQVALKLIVLLKSLAAFALMSIVTALVVRMLMASGVVLMFPLFHCLRSLGCAGADMSLLRASYPWLGVNMDQLRLQNKPVGPFILAHAVCLFTYYAMYEASQLLWAETLYNKSVPNGLPFLVYGLLMVLEYYSMIFVRCSTSIWIFPRVSLLYFVLFHVYFWSIPYGFYVEVFLGIFLLYIHAMLYSVLYLELPACRRGEVSYETPRALYNDTGMPQLQSALPPSYTLFFALNSRSQGAYSQAIPNRPGAAAGRGGPRGGTQGAAGGSQSVQIAIEHALGLLADVRARESTSQGGSARLPRHQSQSRRPASLRGTPTGPPAGSGSQAEEEEEVVLRAPEMHRPDGLETSEESSSGGRGRAGDRRGRSWGSGGSPPYIPLASEGSDDA